MLSNGWKQCPNYKACTTLVNFSLTQDRSLETMIPLGGYLGEIKQLKEKNPLHQIGQISSLPVARFPLQKHLKCFQNGNVSTCIQSRYNQEV